MARNEEKSQSVLNRWLDYQRGDSSSGRRPTLTSSVNSVKDAERWRMSIIKEMSNRVIIIQNESLDETRTRDLNDEINELMKEKSHWDRRVRELGGADFRNNYKFLDPHAVVGPGGYVYFGAAKNLPGVKDMVKPEDEETQEMKQKKRVELLQLADSFYYGYLDDYDEKLEQIELEAEEKARDESFRSWANAARERGEDVEALLEPPHKKQKAFEYTAHVPLPDKAELEAQLLEKKRMELLKLYNIDA